MQSRIIFSYLLTLAMLLLYSNIVFSQHDLLILKREVLEENKGLILNQRGAAYSNYLKLIKEADSVLLTHERTIVNKEILPPSNDPHDFFSLAPYWWPNPKKKNGLPYIRRDGKTNPESSKVRDKVHLVHMVNQVNVLALAFFYSNDEKYAKKALEKINVWFLNKNTKMNPNMNFAQHIRGVNKQTGNSTGMIETREMVDLIDSFVLLEKSKFWSDQVSSGLKSWFSEYLMWLDNSSFGKQVKREMRNNIGTAYYMQKLAYAIFSNQISKANNIISNDLPKLMDDQFDIEGKQKYEITRTLSFNYSVSNLFYWRKIALLCEHLDFDLLNYKTPNGKSLQTAFKWIEPYIENNKPWPFQQIKNNDLSLYSFKVNYGNLNGVALNNLRSSSNMIEQNKLQDRSPYELLTVFNLTQH